jgi:hypothetical protein
LSNSIHNVPLEFATRTIPVTGQLKTGHLRALQNRPLQGDLFISGFLMHARGFSLSSYLLNGGTGYAKGRLAPATF